MSSYYGVVFPEFWTGRTGRELRERGGKDAQLLGLYLLSNRHTNMLGLYKLMVEDVTHETGLPKKSLVKGYEALAAASFATFDSDSSFVWVRQMVRFRIGLKPGDGLKTEDNRVSALNRLYHALDPNPFLKAFFELHHRTLHLKSAREPQGVVVPLSIPSPLQGASEGLPSQITDNRDQITEIRQQRSETDPARKEQRAPTPTREAFTHYHTRFVQRYGVKPEYGSESERGKHSGQINRLLKLHGLEGLKRRFDAYFDSGDPFLANSGHTLELFYSSAVQTKLAVALRPRTTGADADASDKVRRLKEIPT